MVSVFSIIDLVFLHIGDQPKREEGSRVQHAPTGNFAIQEKVLKILPNNLLCYKRGMCLVKKNIDIVHQSDFISNHHSSISDDLKKWFQLKFPTIGRVPHKLATLIIKRNPQNHFYEFVQ